MALSRLVSRARRLAESHMVDECEIRRPDVVGALNPTTGAQPVTPGALVYSGKCKLFTYEPFETVVRTGQHGTIVQRYWLHVPVDADGIQVDDIATFTAATFDAQLIGRKYRIAGLMQKSLARDQRLPVDEVTG